MKTLIWDFDGTLAWRSGGWSGALLNVLRKHDPTTKATVEQIRPYLLSGFPWHAPENPHTDQSTADWWDELQPLFARALRAAGAGDASYRLAGEVRVEYCDPRAWQLYDDTLPALATLTDEGWRHILLTNHVPELPDLLAALGLQDSFAAVLCSAQTGYEKPHPKAFRAALDLLSPAETVYIVGDNYSADVRGAAEVGLAGVLVRKPHPQAQRFFATLPAFTAWATSSLAA